MPEPIAYLNGQWVTARAAALPVTDSGFVLGTTVSEQLRTFRGKIFRLEDHWRRLARSLEIVGVSPPSTLAELAYAAEALVEHNHALLTPGDDLGLVIAITPGSLGSFARAACFGPHEVLHTYPLAFARWADDYRKGVHLRTTPVRQVSEVSWPPELKCRSRVHYFLADQSAERQEPGARALLLDEFGQVNETSTANVLAVSNQRLASPPRARILPGISLATVAELAQERGWVYEERPLELEELFTADEVLLTSTPFCMLPVTALNGRPIGTGTPGAVFGELLGAWSERVGVEIAAQATRCAQFSSEP
jgi:branched-subunit amino acid aminotransferase/4-amino-4-deoxychorismate lyase